MLIDTHCHVNFNAYQTDAAEVIQNALARDIWLINVGSQFSTSQRAVQIAEKYPQGVYAVVGLHPIHLYQLHVDEAEQGLDFVSRAENFIKADYEKLLAHPRTVGIGEMGIDYFHLPADEDLKKVKTRQKEVFLQGIKVAQEFAKPIVVHTRPSKGTSDAYDEVIEVLKKADYFQAVVHCFSGTKEQARQLLDLGVHLSFTGIITFPNAKEIQELVRFVPLDQMMVETDAPYLSPEPYRGKRNEPAYVELVAKKIAAVKNLSFDKVAQATTATARKFFNL